MGIHDYHQQSPNYDAEQTLHDDCGECKRRSDSVDHGIATMDLENFTRAWQRAAAWNRVGLSNVSQTEAPLLSTLWSIQIKLERLGLPIGEVPSA